MYLVSRDPPVVAGALLRDAFGIERLDGHDWPDDGNEGLFQCRDSIPIKADGRSDTRNDESQ